MNRFLNIGRRQGAPTELRALFSIVFSALVTLAGGLFMTVPAQAADRIVYSLGLHSNDSCLTNVDAGAVRGADGTVYWASAGTFCSGLLSSRAPDGTYTTLHAFNGNRFLDIAGNPVTDLGAPRGTPIIASDGNLYGIGFVGGANDQGGVYRYRLTGANAGEYRVLFSFDNQNNGCGPLGGVIEASDGNLYGTTSACAGPNNRGTVFKLTKAGVLTVLKNFSTPATAADGARSIAALTQGTDGAFYGTTADGGTNANGGGTIFRVTAGGTFTQLHSFAGDQGIEGSRPGGEMALGSDGNFYGTTEVGGPTGSNSLPGRGTVFRITPAGVFTRLYTFYGDSASPDGVTGVNPTAGLVRAGDGNFYGLNNFGSGCRGALYRVTPAGVASQPFCFIVGGTSGNDATATLTLGGDGQLYGTTRFGGVRPTDTGNANPTAPDLAGGGVVFRFNINGTLTNLFTLFSTPTEGRFPSGALLQASDGTFYGVTATDAKKGGGTIFSLTPGGVLNTVHVLTNVINGSPTEGRQPEAGLAIGPDGAFYGIAEVGGINGVGSVFRVTTAGAYSTLYNFTGGANGLRPRAALTLGADNNFYGTTQEGGSNGFGTIFRVSPSGAYTKLYDYVAATVGQAPQGKLLLANDGNFYGTGRDFAAGNVGSVFRMTPAGVVSVLHAFAGAPTEGATPIGGVVQGADGALYGTTSGGGTATRGTVYRLTLAGAYSTLYNFNDTTPGVRPLSPLLLARDGNFYGTTASISFNVPRGVLYRITPQGQYSVVHQLAEVGDGLDFEDEPIQASNATGGELIVPTRNGGAFGFGAVLAISAPADRVVNLTGTPAVQSAVLSWSTVPRALTYNIYRATTAGGEGTTPIATGITAAGLTAGYTATGLTAGTPYFFTVTAVNTMGETQFSNEVSVTPTAPATPAPAVTIAANPTTITLGASTALTWSSTNATSCVASGAWAGNKALSGTESVTPTAVGSPAYTLTCTGTGGSGNATATVTVNPAVVPAPTVTIAANPTTLILGAASTLTWSSTNATACTASGAWTGTRATSGTASVTPSATGSAAYTLTCTGTGGSGNATATVTVNPVPAPTVTLAVNPSSIRLGASAALTWSSTNATSCSASGAWTGSRATSGTESVSPTATGTAAYTLSCTGAGGVTVSNASLTVNPAKKGGGAFGWLGLLLGLPLAALRRSRRQVNQD